MLEGLETIIVDYSTTFSNKDFRIDSDFWTKEPKKNPNLKYDKIGNLLVSAQYGISVSMNEDGIGYPIYRMNEIHNMMCDLEVDKHADIINEEFKKFRLNDREVLFNRTNSFEWVGRTGIYRKLENQEFTFASYLVRFIPDENYIYPEYLTTYLNTKYGIWDVKRRSRQSINQTNVNPEEVKEIYIPLLNKDIQNFIKNSFEIAHNNRLESKKLNKQAETLLLETLGLKDFEPNSEAVNVKGFKESFLNTGRLDAEYYQKKYEDIENKLFSFKNGTNTLKNIIEFITTGEYSMAYQEKSNSSVPYIRNTNLSRGEIELDDNFYVNPNEFKTKASIGEVLTSRVGTIGLFGVIKEEQENAVYSDNILAFKLNDDYIPEVYALLFTTSYYKLLLEKLAGGSVQPLITQTSIKELPVPKIDYSTQKEIASLILESFKLKKESEQLLEMAKRAVEVAIEEGEEASKAYIVYKTIELSNPDLIVHIYISERIKEIDFTEANSNFTTGNVVPVFIIQECETYMCLEWAIPAAITVVVGAFSNGFFGEMGKDAYKAFKNGLKQLAKKARDINVYLIGTKPVDQNNKQSKSFCIDSKTASGTQIRFLFDKDGSIDEWEVWIDKATALLADNYLQDNNEMQRKLDALERPLSSPVFWTFNRELDEWEAYDTKKSVRLEYEERMKNDNKNNQLG